MKTWIKATIAFLIPAGLILWLWDTWNNITIELPSFRQFDIASLLSNFISPNPSTPATVTLTIPIKNDNGFSISASNLYAELSYGGAVVAKSSNVPDNAKKFVIPANGTASFDHTLDIFVNDQFKNAIGAVIGGGEMKFDYYIRLKLFGFIPFWWHDTFTYTK